MPVGEAANVKLGNSSSSTHAARAIIISELLAGNRADRVDQACEAAKSASCCNAFGRMYRNAAAFHVGRATLSH